MLGQMMVTQECPYQAVQDSLASRTCIIQESTKPQRKAQPVVLLLSQMGGQGRGGGG